MFIVTIAEIILLQFLRNQHKHLDFIVINAANFVIKDLHLVSGFHVSQSVAYL